MFCTAMLILLLCCVGVVKRFFNWQNSVRASVGHLMDAQERVILESLERAEENAVEIRNASLTINDTALASVSMR